MHRSNSINQSQNLFYTKAVKAFRRVFTGSRYFVLVWTLVLTFKPSDYYQDVYYIGPALVTVLDMFRSSFTRFITFSSTRRRSGCKKHLFKVNFSLQLMNATLMAIFLILLAGDISRNPGPINKDTSEGIQVENIPVLISSRSNYSGFNQPSKRNFSVQRNYPNNNLTSLTSLVKHRNYQTVSAITKQFMDSRTA